jgi:hypothetical protein
MNDGDVDPQVRNLLERAGREVAQMNSVAPRILARLESVSMAPRRSGRRFRLIAVIAGSASMAACFAWLVPWTSGVLPHPEDRRMSAPSQPLPPPVAVVTLGDTTVTQHLAMLVDSRAVLVLWSYRGGTSDPNGRGTKPSPRRLDDYTEWRLGSGRDPDGTAWRWSLFIADPKVQAMAAPPAIQVCDLRLGRIRFAITPQTCSWKDVGRAIDSVAAGARSAPDLAEIERLVKVHAPSI